MTKHTSKLQNFIDILTKLWPIGVAIITLVGSMYLSQYRLVKTEDEIKGIKDKQSALWRAISHLKSDIARLDERTKNRGII